MTPKALSNILRCLGNAVSAETIEDKNIWIGRAIAYIDVENLSTNKNNYESTK